MRHLFMLAMWLTEVGLSWLSDLSGNPDLSLTGWALAGSTVWVLFEVINKVDRPGTHRLYLILIGMLCSLGFSQAVAESWHTNPRATTFGIGLFAYVLLGPAKDFLLKWVASKAGTLSKPPDQNPPPTA